MRIWTIGHSTRSLDDFVSLLRAHQIEAIADVRHHPGSRRLPHFNREALADSLRGANIEYRHIIRLGGRRRPAPDSTNTAWRNESFRGYADYMATSDFAAGLGELCELAGSHRTAAMCAEALWWRCHRALVSDLLKAQGHEVLHILGPDKVDEHPFTSAARMVNGRLSYSKSDDDQPKLL
jgi:uncharacterized protein (DUF488 family)